ncbi:5'-nucleotidase C-terminal domain-containing protein [bacterium]|nr:5'-nucleotidase C-terminal domain-containing protein [bacterium]
MLFAALTLLIAGCGRNSAESSISSEAPPGSRSLVLLFTGDMHSNLENYPQLAELVERERAMAQERGVPLLLLSTGDAPMGTIYHTLFTTNAADYRALSLLGYDASALGNHDFDFGPHALLRSLTAADSLAALSLPLLCANIQIEGDTSGRVAKYIIIQRDSLRILVTATMGLDAIRSISAADSLNYTPADAALATLLPQLPDCHFRILLSHGGTSWVGNEQVTEETPSALRRRRKTEDALLAAKVPLFDAILSGHDHAPLFTPLIVGKTVLGNSGANLQYLGRVELAKDSSGRTRLVDYRLIPIPASTACPASHFASFVEERYREVAENMQRVYGIALPDTLLPSLAATKFADLSTPDLVAEAYSAAPVLLQTAAAAPAPPALLQTAAAAPATPALAGERPIGIVPFGVVRGQLPHSGAITWRRLFELLSLGSNREGLAGYPLVKLYLYGKELFDICELDASYARPGNDLHLHFSSNLKYYGRAIGIPFMRITEVFANGAPVERNRLYPIVTDLYTAQSIKLLEESSFGLLKAAPKDSSGNIVSNPAAYTITASIPAVQGAPVEMTGWMALGLMLSSQAPYDK